MNPGCERTCKCIKERETAQFRYSPDGSNAVQMWSAVASSVGVQVCPAFTPQPDAAAKTASRSQRDEDTNAQRGMRGGRGVSEWAEQGGGVGRQRLAR